MYEYKAKVIKVYDADTITVNMDLGFDVHITKSIRLADIDAPEIRGKERPEGLKARDFLRTLILDKEVIIKTERDRTGKYGRYICNVFYEKDDLTIHINDLLVKEGYVTYKKY